MSEPSTMIAARQRWMSVLAKSSPKLVEECVARLGELPAFKFLRAPEQGAVMVRARAGGDGAAFCLGEMTVTRCAVEISGGAVGHAYVQGRDAEHAKLAAVFDAVAQDENERERVLNIVIEPLEQRLRGERKAREQDAASSKVEFFTVARGENRA